MAALDTQGIVDAVVSHALASGLFEQVNAHEPANAPASGGLSAAVWVDQLGPARASSGLAASSARLVLMVRLYTSVLTEPADLIDPALTAAVDVLMRSYSGDFTLGGAVRAVDLLGAEGVALEARAGYLQQDSATFRVFTITLPLLVNDLWEQTP